MGLDRQLAPAAEEPSTEREAPQLKKQEAALPLPLGLSQQIKPHPGFTSPAH